MSATLKNIKEFDLHYLTRKLTAHSDERWSFNYKKALRELDEWYLERKDDQLDDLDELHEDLREATMNFSLHEHFKTAVFSIYETTTADWFDTEEAESVSDFGSELPHQFIAYWVGLQMAIATRKNKYEFCIKVIFYLRGDNNVSYLCDLSFN
ncbi:hypothetical protein QNN00_17660 [Bacillus velezensis]|nr:hypothetical protein [Bacillus velezensis]